MLFLMCMLPSQARQRIHICIGLDVISQKAEALKSFIVAWLLLFAQLYNLQLDKVLQAF